MILLGSRYVDSEIDTVSVDGQVRQVIVPSPQGPYVITYRSYMMTSNDSLEALADLYYGNPQWWWQIADANPEILDWFFISAGTIIRIPVTSA